MSSTEQNKCLVIKKSDPESEKKTVECLKSGGIAVLPTDTVYGFSAVSDFKGEPLLGTDAKIREIKGRSENKPLIQLIAEPSDIFKYTDSVIPSSLLEKWPGPLTLIVPVKKNCPLVTSLESIAFRCPGDLWLRRVISECGRTVYSTSVNRSGSPVLQKVSDIIEEFSSEIDLMVDNGDSENALPSTIVSIADGNVRLIRKGCVQI